MYYIYLLYRTQFACGLTIFPGCLGTMFLIVFDNVNSVKLINNN